MLFTNFINVIYFIIVIIYAFQKDKSLSVNIFIVFPTYGRRGPSSLSRYIKRGIEKWNGNKSLRNIAKLFHKESLLLKSAILIVSRKNSFVWFEMPSYINLIYETDNASYFNKILYGPIVSPQMWFKSPINNTYEAHWCRIMKRIKGYVVHSKRVRNHIMNYSNCSDSINKYFILKQCIEIENMSLNINPINTRKNDVLVYIKYADIKRKSEERILLKYLRERYKVITIYYGRHSKETLLTAANESKFVIYFSFYDTGALSLLEMKLMGAWPISHQKEFIETGYGTYAKELDTNISKFLLVFNDIMKISFNPYKLSQQVIRDLNCISSLKNIVYALKDSL